MDSAHLSTAPRRQTKRPRRARGRTRQMWPTEPLVTPARTSERRWSPEPARASRPTTALPKASRPTPSRPVPPTRTRRHIRRHWSISPRQGRARRPRASAHCRPDATFVPSRAPALQTSGFRNSVWWSSRRNRRSRRAARLRSGSQGRRPGRPSSRRDPGGPAAPPPRSRDRRRAGATAAAPRPSRDSRAPRPLVALR